MISDLLTLAFYAATYGTLSYLSWREYQSWRARRDEASRLPRINVDPPRFDGGRRRNDPSPRPRKPAA